MDSKHDEYIANRMLESKAVRNMADSFYEDIANFSTEHDIKTKDTLKESVFYLCQKYDCKELITVAYRLS
jgi:hypothetical protein